MALSKVLSKIRTLKQLFRYLIRELPVQMLALEQRLDNVDQRLQEMDRQRKLIEDSIQKADEHLASDFSEVRRLLDGLPKREEIDYRYDFLRLKDLLSYGDFVNPEIALLKGRQMQDGEKQLLLIGFYGAYNFGDELMLQTLLQLLDGVKGIHVTLMLSENADYDASINGDVDIIHYCRTRSDFAHLSTFYDGLIVGGGALLDDREYGKTYNHFISLATIVAELPNYFAAKGKPTYFLGMSTNDVITNEKYIAMLSRCVQTSQYFSVRDCFSLETMKRAGIPTDSIEVIDDIVLANWFWLKEREPKERTSEKSCAVTWVNSEELKPLLVELLEAIVQKGMEAGTDIHIDLVPMYSYVEVDKSYFTDVMQKLPSSIADRVALAAYPMTIEQAAEIFSKQDAAVNIRYHASLICACLGIPQTQVVLKDHPHYPNKMRWIAENFGESVQITQTDQTAEHIAEGVWNSFELGRARGLAPERAKRNAELLRRTLMFVKGRTSDEKHA